MRRSCSNLRARNGHDKPSRDCVAYNHSIQSYRLHIRIARIALMCTPLKPQTCTNMAPSEGSI